MIKDDSREIIEDTNIDIDENIVNLNLKSFNDFNVQISEFIIENQKILDTYTKEELKIDSPTGWFLYENKIQFY